MGHCRLFSLGVYSLVLLVLLVFSLSGCETPETESGLTEVCISNDVNGIIHMSNIAVPNDGSIELYVTRKYTYTSPPGNTTPQSTYKWYKNNSMIDGEQKGVISVQGPNSGMINLITVVNGDKIKVIVNDKNKTIEAETTIIIQ
jgi:hypothetical protein